MTNLQQARKRTTVMTPDKQYPLWQRMRALASAGHAHAGALDKMADALEAAVTALDAVSDGAPTGNTLRECLRAQQQAKLAWWRATGEQL